MSLYYVRCTCGHQKRRHTKFGHRVGCRECDCAEFTWPSQTLPVFDNEGTDTPITEERLLQAIDEALDKTGKPIIPDMLVMWVPKKNLDRPLADFIAPGHATVRQTLVALGRMVGREEAVKPIGRLVDHVLKEDCTMPTCKHCGGTTHDLLRPCYREDEE